MRLDLPLRLRPVLLLLPFLVSLGAAPPSSDPAKPGTAPVQESGVVSQTQDLDLLTRLRALLAEGRFDQAVEGARGYLLVNPEGEDSRVARVILCSARLTGKLPPPSFDNPIEPGATEPMRVGGEVRRPEKIYGATPTYTDKAREEKINGIVIYEATIDHEGCVRDLRLLQGLHPDLDASARWAIERWVFRPATLDGHPVPVYYSLTINFQIK